jgi:hypothetical protein
MPKVDDRKETRLALTRPGIATCPEKCLHLVCLQCFQTPAIVVTAQHIYHTDVVGPDARKYNTAQVQSKYPKIY